MKTYNTMKRIFTTVITVIMCASLFAQVKIANNSNLGIGTTNPLQKLHVGGSGYFTGNLGLGIPTPTHRLQVSGNCFFTGNLGLGGFSPMHKLRVEGNSYFTDNMGIGIAPNTTDRLLVSGGALKIGNSNSSTDLAQNMLKIGDGDNIQIGEWEADNMLSFKAANYNFTGTNAKCVAVQYALD